MKSEYRIGSVWGIPVNLHVSLFLLMAYFAVRGGFAGLERGGIKGGAVAVAFILIFEVLLFSSIALHELGHSFVAIRKGCRVREITLMFIGGAAKMEQIPRRPRDEFLMAAAGPAVSIMIGVLIIGTMLLLPPPASTPAIWMSTLFFYVGMVNLILAGFNLLPAFPMDGGRILRAMLSHRFGRLHATRIAAKLGKVIAVLLAFAGLFGIRGLPFFEGRNLFMVLIAGFVFFYGEREYRMVQVEELMRQRGFGTYPPFTGEDPGSPVDDDTVLISPPPYAKGPASRAEIQRQPPNTRSPLDDLFGR